MKKFATLRQTKLLSLSKLHSVVSLLNCWLMMALLYKLVQSCLLLTVLVRRVYIYLGILCKTLPLNSVELGGAPAAAKPAAAPAPVAAAPAPSPVAPAPPPPPAPVAPQPSAATIPTTPPPRPTPPSSPAASVPAASIKPQAAPAMQQTQVF